MRDVEEPSPLLFAPPRLQEADSGAERCCDSRKLGDNDCPLAVDERAELAKFALDGLSRIPLSSGARE
jgi:hypothetical protein